MIFETALAEWGRDRGQIRRDWTWEYLILMIERLAERRKRENGVKDDDSQKVAING